MACWGRMEHPEIIKNMTFTLTQKRILYSVALVAVAAIFGFIIYVVFFKPPAEEQVNVNGELVPVSVFPEISENINRPFEVENVNAFVGVPAIDTVAVGGNTLTETIMAEEAEQAMIAGNGTDMQYYDAEEGIFYRVTPDGEKIAMTDEIFKGVQEVEWSNDSNSAVLTFEDGFNIYYDFESKTQYTLPKEMEDFSFSPNDDQIGYKFMAIDEEDRWLGVINPDGSNPRGIVRLGDNEASVQVNWSPSGKALGTYQEYADGDRQSVVPLGLHGENYKQMMVEGRDFNYEWSEDGKQMAYSVFGAYSDFKPTLWVVDAQGEDIGKNRVPLEINTWADKCTFASSTDMYCAVPDSLPTGAGYAREMADQTPDSIYRINIQTGSKSLVAIPTNSTGTQQYTVEDMYVSQDGSTLYFTDVNTKNINKLKLK